MSVPKVTRSETYGPPARRSSFASGPGARAPSREELLRAMALAARAAAARGATPEQPLMRPDGRRWAGSLVRGLVVHAASLGAALGAFVASQHFQLRGDSSTATASLLAAGVLGLAPLHALARELLALRRTVLRLLHGIGSLAFFGLAATGHLPGGIALARAPLAAVEAVRVLLEPKSPGGTGGALDVARLAAAAGELQRLGSGSTRGSPAEVQRVVAAVVDVLGKAHAPAQTGEAGAGALDGALARVGVTLALDLIDHQLSALGGDREVARALPELRKRLAQARSLVDQGTGTGAGARYLRLARRGAEPTPRP